MSLPGEQQALDKHCLGYREPVEQLFQVGVLLQPIEKFPAQIRTNWFARRELSDTDHYVETTIVFATVQSAVARVLLA